MTTINELCECLAPEFPDGSGREYAVIGCPDCGGTGHVGGTREDARELMAREEAGE